MKLMLIQQMYYLKIILISGPIILHSFGYIKQLYQKCEPILNWCIMPKWPSKFMAKVILYTSYDPLSGNMELNSWEYVFL